MDDTAGPERLTWEEMDELRRRYPRAPRRPGECVLSALDLLGAQELRELLRAEAKAAAGEEGR